MNHIQSNFVQIYNLFVHILECLGDAFHKEYSLQNRLNSPANLIIEPEKSRLAESESFPKKELSNVFTLDSYRALCHPARRGPAWHFLRDTTEIYLPFSRCYHKSR